MDIDIIDEVGEGDEDLDELIVPGGQKSENKPDVGKKIDLIDNPSKGRQENPRITHGEDDDIFDW